MSSILQSVLVSLLDNNYVTLAVMTAVGYDYILTLSKETEYIWNRPWTWVSTLFVLVRYIGLFNVMGPILGEIIDIVSLWTFIIFVFAADLVMILRVWAMYQRSRLVLWITITLFILEITILIVAAAIGGRPQNLSAVTVQIQNLSFCAVQGGSPVWAKASTILQITFGGMVCMLAATRFVMQSFQIYRATQQWQLNRYMNLFAREGIVYFMAFFLFNLFNLLATSGNIPTGGWQVVLTVIVELVPLYTLTPRFILNMRELYARDIRGGHVGGIDTGFGLSSLHGRDTAKSTMVFADAGRNEEQDEDEMPMDGRTTSVPV